MKLLAKVQLHDKYIAVFDNPDGQEVLAHLCKKFHVLSPSFTQGDPHVTSFKEGGRHCVLSILKYINKDTGRLVEELSRMSEE